MPASTDPTDEEFLDDLILADRNTAAAIDEIVRRLRVNLPGKIALMNSTFGWTGEEAIQLPKTIDWAPFNLAEKHVNSVLVSVAVETTTECPQIFKDEAQVVIYSLHNKIEVAQQLKPMLRRAAAIRGVLFHFLTHCKDEAEREVWSLLEPAGVTFLPQPFENYAGLAIHYRMVCNPSETLWAA